MAAKPDPFGPLSEAFAAEVPQFPPGDLLHEAEAAFDPGFDLPPRNPVAELHAGIAAEFGAVSETPPSATKALTCMQTSQVLSASSRLDFEASASICDTSCRCAGSDM